GRVSSDIPICLDRLEVVGCIAVDRKGWHDTKYGIRPAIGGSPVFPWYPIAPQLQPVRGSPFGPLSQISGAGAVRWLAGWRPPGPGLQSRQLPYPYPQQADAARQVDALQPQSRVAADRGRVGGVFVDGGVARHRPEVVEAQLHA